MTPDTPTDTETMTSQQDAPTVALWTLLTDPDAFFRARADDPSFVGPVAVVLLVAGVGILGSIPVLRTTTAAMPAEAGPFVSIVVAIGVIGGVVGTLVAWVLYATAFHVISAVAFGADGGFRTTLALTGWGFVPRLPEVAISSVVAYLVFADARIPSDPAMLQAAIRELRSDPLFVIAGVLGLVFLAWSALLWTFAMRHARGLTLRQAALTVAFPVLVSLAIDLLGLLGVF